MICAADLFSTIKNEVWILHTSQLFIMKIKI